LSYVQEWPQAATARDQLPYGLKEFPATLQGPEVKQTAVQAVEAFYTGQMTPEESLRAVQERIDDILRQAGCMID
jgi:maltose-binding protein MalE